MLYDLTSAGCDLVCVSLKMYHSSDLGKALGQQREITVIGGGSSDHR